MIRYLATLALALAASFVQADGIDFGKPTTVGLHIGSQHFPARDHNNANPGLYVSTDRQWVAGAYYNSERRMSAYVARDFDLGAGFGVRLGGVVGYELAPLMPLAALTYKLPAGFRLAFIPPVDKSAAVLHLAVEFAL